MTQIKSFFVAFVKNVALHVRRSPFNVHNIIFNYPIVYNDVRRRTFALAARSKSLIIIDSIKTRDKIKSTLCIVGKKKRNEKLRILNSITFRKSNFFRSHTSAVILIGCTSIECEHVRCDTRQWPVHSSFFFLHSNGFFPFLVDRHRCCRDAACTYRVPRTRLSCKNICVK